MQPSNWFYFNFVATLFLTGLIWVIQILHYPSFQFVGAENFIKFHEFHSSRITFIVAPLMLLEIVTSAYLLNYAFNSTSMFNLVTVLLLWGLTFFISVPIHTRLSEGYNLELIQKLVTTNWYRTALWTVRSFFLTFLLIYNSK
jgi:hypothetical protein